MIRDRVIDVRFELIERHQGGFFAENNTIEIVNASFIADEKSIFGKVSEDYSEAELLWYYSQSRNVLDIPGKIPKIWLDIAGDNNMINSNYGWCIFSEENHEQYNNALTTLRIDKYSRQAQMIYTRPTMHKDSCRLNMKDFICTTSVQLIIRDNQLNYIVSMRSSDAVFGYKNDKFWHDHVHNKAFEDLKYWYPDLELGTMYWNAASLHVYPRHYKLIEDYYND